MEKIFCDGCEKQLEPGPEPYFRIGEIHYEVPRAKQKHVRVHFQQGDIKMSAETQPWLWYADLAYCRKCWKKPRVLADIVGERV